MFLRRRLFALGTDFRLVAVVSLAFVADSVVAVVDIVVVAATAVTSQNTAIAVSAMATVEERQSMCVADRQASRRWCRARAAKSGCWSSERVNWRLMTAGTPGRGTVVVAIGDRQNE